MTSSPFASSAEEWVKMPIDDQGYFSWKDIESWKPEEFKERFDKFIETREHPGKWRNFQHKWRDHLTDDIKGGKMVLDYGSGFGVEAIAIMKNDPKNRVILADMHENNLEAACKVMALYEVKADSLVMTQFEPPFFTLPKDTPPIDVFYSNGVLHHSPHFRAILERACSYLSEDGIIRLMVYSDKAWTMKTGQPLEISQPIETQSGFKQFVGAMDSVGKYATWYNKEKLEKEVGDFLEITDCAYITADDLFLAVTLKPKK